MSFPMIRGKQWFTGFTPEECFIAVQAFGRGPFKDGKPTGVFDAVRVAALMQDGRKINFDLVPFTEEKLKRCQRYFTRQFSISNLVGIEDCKIFSYQGDMRVIVTAADLRIEDDPWGVVKV